LGLIHYCFRQLFHHFYSLELYISIYILPSLRAPPISSHGLFASPNPNINTFLKIRFLFKTKTISLINLNSTMSYLANAALEEDLLLLASITTR
jgi:hypothetical protein